MVATATQNAEVRAVLNPGKSTTPAPAAVRYNDWRAVDVPALETFAPAAPVSVIIPSDQTPANK